MALRVTLNIDGQRKTGDMARHHQDVDAKRRGSSSQPLGADSELIDLGQYLRLEPLQFRIGVDAPERPQQALFRKESGLLKVSSDPDSHDRGRTGV